MGHLSLQYGSSYYIVWDISHYSMGHLYIYSMGHLSLQYGTSIYIVWDISHYSMGHLSIQYGTSFDIVWDVSHYSMWHLSLPLRGTVPVIDVRPVLTWFLNLTVCSFCIQWYILCFSTVNVHFDSMGISHYSMGHLSIQYGTSIYTQYETSTYAVWDIYIYIKGHLFIQYGTS